jgi:hypothetical protein
MSNINNIDIIEQIERLAEAFPWDTVSLWLHRRPAGDYSFTAHLESNDKYGLQSEFESGATPGEVASAMIQRLPNRNPEAAREKVIAELKAKIEKLQGVVIGLPPYRPGRELSNGERTIHAQSTINV